MKVLVTGNKGFIGSNLSKNLEMKGIEVIGYNKQNKVSDLDWILDKVDFIFHLAGEVKPKVEESEFEKNNLTLTKIILEKIKNKNKILPILMTSTIHAINPKNAYGQTKRDAELLLEEYSKEFNNENIYIYRLPHVFGEGCKPNYNSVLTTWIYNSINNLEIIIYDKKIKMNYVYVQDIVNEFIETMKLKGKETYYEIPKKYSTTLGEVVEYLNEFKSQNFEAKNNEFKEKLAKTYKYYLEKEEA